MRFEVQLPSGANLLHYPQNGKEEETADWNREKAQCSHFSSSSDLEPRTTKSYLIRLVNPFIRTFPTGEGKMIGDRGENTKST